MVDLNELLEDFAGDVRGNYMKMLESGKFKAPALDVKLMTAIIVATGMQWYRITDPNLVEKVGGILNQGVS